MTIRPATLMDHEAIAEVNRQAFAGEAEAQLVDRLRVDGVVVVELVCVQDARVVGHILFSELRIDTVDGGVPAVSLAPIAVRSECQRQGIGAALVNEGLARCREVGMKAAIVLGHPDYYPRFGFSAALAAKLESPFSNAGDAWMAVELESGALANVCGKVRYPEAFGIVQH